MKNIIVLLSILLTTSCSLSANIPLLSSNDKVSVGDTLQLTQTIIIPADRSFMYIANGKVKKLKNYNTVDIYQPYCTIHLRNESSQTREIEPDYFEITKIVEDERDYGELFNNKYKFVKRGNGVFIKTSMRNDGGPSIVMYATILSLRSTNQAEVKELVCGHWNDAWELEPLTLKEIKSALGGLMIIRAAKGKNI